MAVDQQSRPLRASALPGIARESIAERLRGGGPPGNELLTAATGAALILLLAVIGVTIVQLRGLLSVHLFVGMLLIGPVALKLATTGYRFARYYTGSVSYRRKGPPAAILRAIAPIVVLTTVIVFASGVALLFAGPSARGTLTPIHKISFIVWVAFTALHVLGHLDVLPSALRADYTNTSKAGLQGLGEHVAGRSGRVLALSGAIVAGVVLAILVLPEFGAWLHWNALHHQHDH